MPSEIGMVTRSENDSWTPLHYAAHVGDTETVNKLLTPGSAEVPCYHAVNDKDNGGFTALHLAAQNGHTDTVLALLTTHKADPSVVSNEGFTPLYLAAQNGRSGAVRALISEGKARVDCKTMNDTTPLHVASQNGRLGVVEVLLTTPATTESASAAAGSSIDVDAKNMDEYSALYLAAQSGFLDVVKCILTKGNADVNSTAYDGTTVLHIAVERNDVPLVEYLLTDEKVAAAVDVEAQATEFMIEGFTPLHAAAWNGHTELVQLLLEKGKANVKAATSEGNTPLHVCAPRNQAKAVKALIDIGGADVNATNASLWTPLHMACSSCSMDVVKLLVSEYKDTIQLNPLTDNGCTPLVEAILRGHDDVAEVLIAAQSVVGQKLLPVERSLCEDDPASMRVLEAAGLLI